MFHVSTNKTEESWSRMGIKKAKPSEDSNELVDRIARLSISGMQYETVVDFYRTQLSSWRRFYKQDDNVTIEETFTTEKMRCSRIQSMNIVFYVKEMKDGSVKTKVGFTDFQLEGVAQNEEAEEIEEI